MRRPSAQAVPGWAREEKSTSRTGSPAGAASAASAPVLLCAPAEREQGRQHPEEEQRDAGVVGAGASTHDRRTVPAGG
jgi:hypothetical protein